MTGRMNVMSIMTMLLLLMMMMVMGTVRLLMRMHRVGNEIVQRLNVLDNALMLTLDQLGVGVQLVYPFLRHLDELVPESRLADFDPELKVRQQTTNVLCRPREKRHHLYS